MQKTRFSEPKTHRNPLKGNLPLYHNWGEIRRISPTLIIWLGASCTSSEKACDRTLQTRNVHSHLPAFTACQTNGRRLFFARSKKQSQLPRRKLTVAYTGQTGCVWVFQQHDILHFMAYSCLSLCLVSCALFLNALKRRAGVSFVIYSVFVASKEASQPKTTSDAYVIQWKVAL